MTHYLDGDPGAPSLTTYGVLKISSDIDRMNHLFNDGFVWKLVPRHVANLRGRVNLDRIGEKSSFVCSAKGMK